MHIRRYLIDGFHWLGLEHGEGLILITCLGPAGARISMNGYGLRTVRS